MAEKVEQNELPTCPLYRLCDVEKHRCCTSAWIVINNKVYDVTAFLAEHPGGEEILLEQAGCDCTKIFDSIGHSLDAHLVAEKYVIGELHPDCRPKPQESELIVWMGMELRLECSKNLIISEWKCFSWWGAWLILLLSVVIAVIAYCKCNRMEQQ